MDIQLDEVFDSEGSLPVTNLNLKSKVPQIWKIGDIESNLVARMVSYTSEGDSLKQLKLGDKYAHVILMSLSAKGSPAELKGGLGPRPIESINTIFDVVYQNVKQLKMDAVMFRFPTKKMKGQGPIVQRIIQRLVMQKTGGRFKVVPSMYQFTGKHTYILVVRKNTDIDDIKGMPGINADLYTKVDSDVGEVYINKKDGIQVTKETAIAGSIAAVEEKRTDKAVISRTKVSRRQVAASQSLESNRFEGPVFQKYEETAAKFSKPVTAKESPMSKDFQASNSSLGKGQAVDYAKRDSIATAWGLVGGFTKDNPEFTAKLRKEVEDKMIKVFRNVNPNSVKSLQAYAEVLNTAFDQFKNMFYMKQKQAFSHLPEPEQAEVLNRSWVAMKSKYLKDAMKSYANAIGNTTQWALSEYTPSQYTPNEKRGIREYCASGYSDMNNVLLGRYSEEDRDVLTEDEAIKAINRLDDAFEKGDKLPDGVTLYRSQTLRQPIFESMVKNKVFYFRNFVSTSVYPIIFGGWKGTAAVGMLPDEARTEYNVDQSDEGVVATDVPKAPIDTKVMLGLAITGAEKINVVIPGDLSSMAQEQEVILPRGTMIKINKITDASYNDGVNFSNNKFVQAEVLTSEQMDESTVVYDGDALLESGELVAMDDSEDRVSFASFSSSGIKSEVDQALSILASCMDLQDVPYKFAQS